MRHDLAIQFDSFCEHSRDNFNVALRPISIRFIVLQFCPSVLLFMFTVFFKPSFLSLWFFLILMASCVFVLFSLLPDFSSYGFDVKLAQRNSSKSRLHRMKPPWNKQWRGYENKRQYKVKFSV